MTRSGHAIASPERIALDVDGGDRPGAESLSISGTGSSGESDPRSAPAGVLGARVGRCVHHQLRTQRAERSARARQRVLDVCHEAIALVVAGRPGAGPADRDPDRHPVAGHVAIRCCCRARGAPGRTRGADGQCAHDRHDRLTADAEHDRRQRRQRRQRRFSWIVAPEWRIGRRNRRRAPDDDSDKPLERSRQGARKRPRVRWRRDPPGEGPRSLTRVSPAGRPRPSR